MTALFDTYSLVGRGMWPGCIYAAVQDMKIIELALLREPCFTTEHSGGYDSGTVCKCSCCWPKTVNSTEAAVPVSSGLDYFHECFSTSRPNNLCAGVHSVLCVIKLCESIVTSLTFFIFLFIYFF